ncbi:hypothetical protein FQN49_001827 [Arthroderma sp. PD_2]|nr:hypothetical protein FQN49_001827 [Arthroderma sp. PD_2]
MDYLFQLKTPQFDDYALVRTLRSKRKVRPRLRDDVAQGFYRPVGSIFADTRTMKRKLSVEAINAKNVKLLQSEHDTTEVKLPTNIEGDILMGIDIDTLSNSRKEPDNIEKTEAAATSSNITGIQKGETP